MYEYYLGFFMNHAPSNGDVSILLMTTETFQVQYSVEAPGVGYYRNGTTYISW